MMGKPVIEGTRITVELFLERLGDGWPLEELIEACPGLRVEHVRAAQGYAAAYQAADESVFLTENAQ